MDPDNTQQSLQQLDDAIQSSVAWNSELEEESATATSHQDDQERDDDLLLDTIEQSVASAHSALFGATSLEIEPSDHTAASLDPLLSASESALDNVLDPILASIASNLRKSTLDLADPATKRQALLRLGNATDIALAANKAYQEGILNAMKKLDAVTNRTLELERLTEHAEEIMSIPTDFVVVAPNVSSVALPWFKHFFGRDLDPNPDGIERDEYLDTIRTSFWTKAEQSLLKQEVVAANNRAVAALATKNNQDVMEALASHPPEFFLFDTALLDWDKISLVISRRSAAECKIQWLQRDHPSLIKSKWTYIDLQRLYTNVANLEAISVTLDWFSIALEFPGRSASDCLQMFARRPMEKKEWSAEQDNLLRAAVKKYGESWQAVALEVGRNATHCVNRWTKSVKPDIVRGKWMPEEDAALLKAVQELGMFWKPVSEKMGGRTDAQCRERYYNRVNPELLPTKIWSAEEDAQLVNWRIEGHSFSQIAILFKNRRTDNHCIRRHEHLAREVKAKATKATKGKVVKAKKPRGAPKAKRAHSVVSEDAHGAETDSNGVEDEMMEDIIVTSDQLQQSNYALPPPSTATKKKAMAVATPKKKPPPRAKRLKFSPPDVLPVLSPQPELLSQDDSLAPGYGHIYVDETMVDSQIDPLLEVLSRESGSSSRVMMSDSMVNSIPPIAGPSSEPITPISFEAEEEETVIVGPALPAKRIRRLPAKLQ